VTMYDQLIRQSFDVVGTSGDEYVCKCPWHDDGKKPNLYINGQKGVYLCHSCGAKGHLRSLGQTLPPMPTQTVRERMAVMNAPPEQPRVLNDDWLKQYDLPHEAWDKRLSKDIQEEFQLGYDVFQDVLTIPLRDVRGRLMGVITRRLDDLRPKYRYPKNFKIGKHLFAAWKVRNHHQKVAIVEGSVDAIACWEARVPAVALMGSRLTEDQQRVLVRMGVQHIVLMLDNDKAGVGWPTHRIFLQRNARQGQHRYRCVGCGRTFQHWSKGVHEAAGTYQVHDMLKGSGIMVSVGEYRPYWLVKDPAALKPDRRRKMFHSAKPWHEWQRMMTNANGYG
jgi:Toprim-like/CHC2 zinc finger